MILLLRLKFLWIGSGQLPNFIPFYAISTKFFACFSLFYFFLLSPPAPSSAASSLVAANGSDAVVDAAPIVRPIRGKVDAPLPPPKIKQKQKKSDCEKKLI